MTLSSTTFIRIASTELATTSGTSSTGSKTCARFLSRPDAIRFRFLVRALMEPEPGDAGIEDNATSTRTGYFHSPTLLVAVEGTINQHGGPPRRPTNPP